MEEEKKKRRRRRKKKQQKKDTHKKAPLKKLLRSFSVSVPALCGLLGSKH